MVDLSITDSLTVGTLVCVTCSVVGIIILSDLYFLFLTSCLKLKMCLVSALLLFIFLCF